MRRRDAFTLIELLIAIGIIGLLVGMSTPLLSLSRRNAYQTNTKSILHRVSAACQQFKNDTTGFPYNAWSLTTNPPPDENTTPPANLLALRLARTMDAAYRGKLNTDLATSAAFYTLASATCITSGQINQPRTQAWVDDAFTTSVAALHLNLLARRWANANVIVGNTGVKQTVQSGTNPWIDGATAIVPAAQSQGYGDDYLGPWLPKRTVSGDELCDAWGTPLLYICPVQPGIKGYYPFGGADLIDTTWYGFGPRSQRSATTSRTSDLRNTAISTLVYQFEVWSIGPDATVSSLRDATTRVNDDNIPGGEYLKGLQ